MIDDRPRGCPEPSVLSAFAEGKLDLTERMAVEQHVSGCAECPSVVGEVMRFLEESTDESEDERDDEPEAGLPRHPWWLIAAAVAAIGVPALVWRTIEARDPLRHVRELAEAEPVRAVEGRLHDFRYARYDVSRAAESEAIQIGMHAERERLDKRGDDARVMHARGVAALLTGDAVEAVRLLRLAAVSDERNAAIWNDLAVAELARADARDPAMLTSALGAAERSLALTPSASAHFNRGVALGHLGRADDAGQAFQQALTAETSPAWRKEISERLTNFHPVR